MTICSSHLNKLISGSRYFISFLLILTMGNACWAYEENTASRSEITRFEILQRGISFYDNLLKENYLEADWATHLIQIHLSIKKMKEEDIFVIEFQREGASPNALYLFFDRQGEYSGASYANTQIPAP